MINTLHFSTGPGPKWAESAPVQVGLLDPAVQVRGGDQVPRPYATTVRLHLRAGLLWVPTESTGGRPENDPEQWHQIVATEPEGTHGTDPLSVGRVDLARGLYICKLNILVSAWRNTRNAMSCTRTSLRTPVTTMMTREPPIWAP